MPSLRETPFETLLPLTHSWPLFEADQRLDLGCLLPGESDASSCSDISAARLARQGAGLWECALADCSLTWTAGVYDLFGLPRGADITRDEVVALYAEPSRAAMERLRAYAIKHRRGFTIDAEIVPFNGARRWMRLIAAPIHDGRRAVRLHGIKKDVTALYN